MKHRRLLLILLLAPLGLLALVAGAVALVLPAERVAAVAAERARAALGREVEVGRVSLHFFPRPAVALEAVSIGGPTPESPALATTQRVLLRPRLLPLLRRQVVVDAVVLDRPRLLVEVDEEGKLNLPELGGDEAAGGGDLEFSIDRLEIRDGRLAYRDRRDGTVVRLDGYDQRLRLKGELSGGELARIALEGELSVAALGADLPGRLATPLRDVRLRIAHRAMLDRPADSLALETLEVAIQEVTLEGRGTVRGLVSEEARRVSLALAAGPFDVGELLRSLPQELLQRGGDGKEVELPEAGGRASVRLSAEGPLGGGRLPDVRGTVTLEQVSVAYADLGDVMTGLGGEVAFSLDSLASEGLSGRLFGEPLQLSFVVRDPAAPAGRVAVRTVVDLGRATALGLVPDSLQVGGRIGLDLVAQGPARATVDGRVQLQGVSVRTAAMLQPAVVEAGSLALRGQSLKSEGLRLRLGEGDLAVDLEVRDWVPLAVGDSTRTPRATFDARSQRLDLDAVFGIPEGVTYSELLFARLADRKVGGRPVEAVAREAGFGLPALPPVELTGRVRAAQLRKNALDFRDVDLQVAGTGDQLELREARFQLMGGGIQIAGRLGAPTRGGEGKAGYPTTLTYRVQDVGAAPFFDRFTPFKEHLSGSLLLAGTARMVLDEHLLPLRESVLGDGTIAVTNGRLVNWEVVRALGRKLEVARFDTLTFSDWTGAFQIAGPQIALRESMLRSELLEVQSAGTLDFSGRLDLAATLRLAPTLAGRVRGEAAPRLAAVAAGSDGRIPVGMRLTGPATSPDIRLDFSQVAANAVAEARREAESRARDLAEEALRKTTPVPALDSLPAAVDSARARLEDQLKKRLRRLRPGGG